MLPCAFSMLYGQQRSFSPAPEVFINELVKHMTEYGQEHVAVEVKKFKAAWDAGKFDDKEKQAIRDICEDMLYKKLAVQPYFELFISTINFYFANNIEKKVLTQWQDISGKLLSKNTKDYLAFLQTANKLFAENILYSSEQQKWYADNNKFELVYDGRVAVKFKYLNLTCEAFLDRMQIFDTEGTFYPDKANWVGRNGKVNWSRVGLPEEVLFCKLTNYKIDFIGSTYTADSVYLRYPKYFKGDVLGMMTDQVSFTTSQDQLMNGNYPKFSSYKGNVKIDGLVGDLATYSGGFSLQGKVITGDNVSGEPVTITLFQDKKPRVVLQSKSFKINEGVAGSLNASFKVLLDSNRSVFHPAIEVRYDFNKKELVVNKGEKGLMLMTFQDDFHGVEIDADRVVWKQLTPYIEFRNMSPDKPVAIESKDFFKEFRYEKVQGILAYNPLYRMRDYSLKTQQRKFHLDDYCAYYQSKKEYIQEQIINLADDGYIYYDMQTDSIEIRDRLYNYVNNHMQVRDYDVIRMISVISARPNVTLSLNNMNLQVEGVRKFTFSDSQNCIAVPHEQQVLIKKDRAMNFGGVVRAGKVDFYSKSFNFEYNSFMIRNTHFDSMVLYYPDETTKALRKVQSVLSDLYGTLEFDYPKNKSGLKKKDYPEYPIFTSERGSKVHYEYEQTHNFVYKRDNFYFEVDPFRITNLNDFTAADLKLPGTFISADIFPDFRYELTIQPDFSLGFVKDIDLPMYMSKGNAKLNISLSNQGLYGNGEIQYLTSITKSNDFLILPKETQANSKTFDLPESSKYPLVAGVDVSTRWLPYEDKMLVSHNTEKFNVFQTKYQFGGILSLEPTALSGNGQLEWSEAEFFSKKMVYGRNKVDADTSGIRIFSIDPGVFAFQTTNVEAHIDFDKRKGHFIANAPDDMTYLPVNQYGTVLSDYTWKMDEKRIEMRPNPKFPALKPYFVSTKADQDSLKFECSYADFDMKENVIYMEKIPYIDVADSRVFLVDGKAIVRKDADMDKLDSTLIEANRVDKYHKIYNTQTKIYGKNNIRASGYYDYKTKLGEQHIINMDSIKIDDSKHLVGVGYILDSQMYFLDKAIGYKGWAKIVSTDKPIVYTGFIKPIHTMDYVVGQWVRFKGDMDAADVVIDVANPRNVDNRPLLSGLFVAGDSVRVYPMLFGMKQGYSNPEVTLDSGVLFYDHASGDIVVGDKKKLFEKEERGNVIRINDQARTIKTEGRFDLSLNVKPGIKTGFAGTSLWKEGDTTYNFDWTVFIDFPLPKEAVTRMIELAKNENFGTATSIKTSAFVANLAEFYTSAADMKTLMSRVKNSGMLNGESVVATSQFFKTVGKASDKVKEIFDSDLYIKEVNSRAPEKAMFFIAASNWRFDNRNNAFICNGAIDIASINGVNINKRFGAILVVDKKRSGDDIHIYIEFTPNEFIYLNYVRGVMYAYATDDKFNQIILEKGEKISNDDYSLRRGTPRSVDKLLRRFDQF